MATLSKELRNALARVTQDAREAAESAARAALENLAVPEKDYRPHMSPDARQLRNRLRARGRALGDRLDERSATQSIKKLTEDAAYEHWHRMLFTRFLAENGLLHTGASQGNLPVTLQDCEELAPELGARDGFELACRFAGETLPSIFRPDDPIFELTLAANDRVVLRQLLESLPSGVFTAGDSLGWTYQFWQAKRKDEVNDSGKKIGADELPAVTQLFTEDYMVDFLLDNTLGAWHAGKVLARIHKLAERAESEEDLRQAVALPGCPWKYLRFIMGTDGNWTPAAGTFDGWPKAARELKCLDPCMGSGHFVVAMFERLVALRLMEEELNEAAAVAAVIRDNLFGLEIDPRCTQIGAFNLALAAWRRVGHSALPAMNLACSGLAPNATEEGWLKLVGGDEKLQKGMGRLYRLFKDAPVLGSLINPRAAGGDLLEAGFHELQPLLDKALARETKEETAHELAVTALGVAKAAEILAGRFTLVATNVPYLGRGKHHEVLADYCERVHPDAKADLATCFIERCGEFAGPRGTAALVTPQNWLFLGTYQRLRRRLLQDSTWNTVAKLGARAFVTISGEVVNVALVAVSRGAAKSNHSFPGIDASDRLDAAAKSTALLASESLALTQLGQLANPDGRIVVGEAVQGRLLNEYADSYWGQGTGDFLRFGRNFWELSRIISDYEFVQSTVRASTDWGGRELIVFWQQGRGELVQLAEDLRARLKNIHRRGEEAWGKPGVSVTLMSQLLVTRYGGQVFDGNCAALVPKDHAHLPAIWTFCSSPDFNTAVRAIDQKLNVTNHTLLKVPFDLAHWQKVASVKYPHGLPRPFSSDPTQWLFNGHPAGADQPLHVAVARLLGYQWPRQAGSSFTDCQALGPDGLDSLADDDGIVCLPAINREQPAVQRLRAVLAESLGKADERALIAGAGSKGGKSNTLEEWLRDDFFEQHCDLFHQRPFVWHVWDGRKDGFHALVNYHKLDHATLKTLTYTYLGDWIRQQEVDAKADKPGADACLGAARALQEKLAQILEGDAPYDIFVRWKPLAKQAAGWHPDLNDGVRMNIRPFVEADVLRKRVKMKWEKDRGKEPVRDKAEYPWFWCEDEPDTDPKPGRQFAGHRWNNVHLSLGAKRAAQGKA